MSDDVLIAIISALSAFLIAALGSNQLQLRRQKRQNEHVNAKLDVVKDQVTNDHDTNLRHDIDAVSHLVGSVKGLLENLGSQVHGLQATVNNMDQRLITTDTRAIEVANKLADHLLTAQVRDDRIGVLEGKLKTKDLI